MTVRPLLKMKCQKQTAPKIPKAYQRNALTGSRDSCLCIEPSGDVMIRALRFVLLGTGAHSSARPIMALVRRQTNG